MSVEIEKLRDLTAKLTEFVVVPGITTRYGIIHGDCIGKGLLFTPQVAVQNAFMAMGSTFPSHAHDAVEVLTIYEGRLQIEVGGVNSEIGAGESIRFTPGDVHVVTALTDCWMIAVTIPADEGYPRA